MTRDITSTIHKAREQSIGDLLRRSEAECAASWAISRTCLRTMCRTTSTKQGG